MKSEHKKGALAKKFAKVAGVVILSTAALAISVPYLSGIFNKNAKPVNPENKIERVEEVTQQKAPEILEQQHVNPRAEALELYKDFLGVLIDVSQKENLGLSDEAMKDIKKFHNQLSKLDLNNLTEKQNKAIDTITDAFQSTSYYGEIPIPETLLDEKQTRMAEKQQTKLEGGAVSGHMEQTVTEYTMVGGRIVEYNSATKEADIGDGGKVSNVRSIHTSIPSSRK